MALFPDYVTVAELKSYLHIDDTVDDTELALAITTASRAVDHAANRQFGTLTSAEVRYFTWEGDRRDGRAALPIFDLATVTDLAVAVDTAGDATWAQTITNGVDFDLWPANAAGDSRPWTHLMLRPTSVARFPTVARGVRVTARWGWTAVPVAVKQAALLLASKAFKRREQPFGIAGSPELGSEMRILAGDRDAEAFLVPYRRPWGAV